MFSDSSRHAVMYEIGAVSTSARSLWRIEHKKTKWSAGFFSWGSEIRLRHVTTGRYLGVLPSEANGSGHCDVVTLSAHEATNAASIFLIRPSKVCFYFEYYIQFLPLYKISELN